ncbi:LOW QUALITY PROTEIN: protein-glutamine gamma-glutamyltransferase 2 [Nerophis ophidion]|uniref:LOW QUALITY PROTEIN: protein-glutamine gamma-glutamyltransferase 2 n=1 Tax=Nerophis ophidion TaxID=159077 RepID=UPI002ADFFDD7|nr:LOW QUALITY PROTEIN: protein-glutamine gamma-glutamyltransferase 2 [Nerophis ophidion]
MAVIMDVDPRCRENNSAHHTKEIDRERLIVRRGQPFSISVQSSESSHRDHHLALILHLGKRGEKVIKVEKERSSKEGWRFTQEGDRDGVLLTLHSPADAIVGHYRLDVLLMTPDGRVSEKNEKVDFHLLFNPWCKDDAVHLSEEKLLQEYIMNEHGMIYTGSWYSIRSVPWHYGQFEDRVMDICFEILDNSNDALRNPEKDLEHRWDPVYVSRIISAMVNSNGDRGVLVGRWHEPYSDGVPPNRWNGSVPILQKWSRGRTRPVKYGQCWVYAAVACTVLRCLGIPTRTITNYSSAHDTDGNLSVDFLVNERLESLDTRGKSDSSWNFHCWVESWMSRVDLPKGNDGWQVLDPTPQELSDGEYCCGPCPVTAIKEGNLGVKFDAPFIFAEVNADIIKWMVRRDGQRQKISVDENSVGRNISTKSPFSDRREDITLQYKYPEGSKKEREICEKAGRRIREPNNEREKPGKLQMTIKPTNPLFGTDFDVVIELKNNGGGEAHAQLTILAMIETYNCINRGEIERQTKKVSVPAYKVHKEVLRLRYDDYAKCVSEQHLIKVMALLEAQGENEPSMVVAKIPLVLPELLVEIHGQAAVNIPLKGSISFTNPLPVPLKRGVFTVEGAGLVSPTEVRMNGEIGPGQKVSVMLTFTPTRPEARKLLVDFDSDRLKDVRDSLQFLFEKGLLLY